MDAVEEIIAEAGKLALCSRCRGLCKVADTRKPDARLMRHASTPDGLCANCAITLFLKNTEPIATILQRGGADLLLAPAVTAQVAAVLSVGNADASIEEIDWAAVVANWEKP